MDLSQLTEKNQRIAGAIKNILGNVVAEGATGWKQFKVTHVGTNLDGSRTIISLQGTSTYNSNRMIRALQSKPITDMSTDELQDIANKKFTYSFQTAWLEQDNSPYLPTAGEPVNCLIIRKANKDGIMSTFIDQIKAVGQAQSKSVSLADVLAGVASVDETEEEAEIVSAEANAHSALGDE